MAASDDQWIEHLPPTPGGARVSASLTTAAAAVRHGGTLEALGYAVVGVAQPANKARGLGDPAGQASAPACHLLVSGHVRRAHPRWWRAVVEHAARVYDIALGPVQYSLSGVIAVHRAAEPPS